MNTEKISVIVPSYNIEEYVERTVKSICNQTYQNLDIILVNDGSSDNTGKILDKLAVQDHRIKVIHKENGGVTRARLCGVEASTGEWIGFVDGDDFIEPQMYEMLINNAVRYAADISHCGYQMVFPNRVDYYYGTGRLVEQDHKTGIKDLLEGTFVEPGLCNKLYNRKLFQELIEKSQMDFSIKNTEDFLMNYYLFNKANKSVFSDECPYHYLVRQGSAATSGVNANNLLDPLKVFRIVEEETKDELDLNQIVKRRIVAQLIKLSTMDAAKYKLFIAPYQKEARKELRTMLMSILKGKYSKKQKCMALCVAVFPGFYSVIHKIYARIKGVDKKYEVS